MEEEAVEEEEVLAAEMSAEVQLPALTRAQLHFIHRTMLSALLRSPLCWPFLPPLLEEFLVRFCICRFQNMIPIAAGAI